MVKNLLNAETKIHGRCGYIRQGFPFIFKDYKYNKFSLHIDGVNSKLSDIDYLSEMGYSLTRHNFPIDYSQDRKSVV